MKNRRKGWGGRRDSQLGRDEKGRFINIRDLPISVDQYNEAIRKDEQAAEKVGKEVAALKKVLRQLKAKEGTK